MLKSIRYHHHHHASPRIVTLLSTHRTACSHSHPISRQFQSLQGATKSNPIGKKTYISEIVADIFTKFAEFTDEDSVHISCIFY